MVGNLLQLRGVTKHFAGVWALSGVDLDLRAGEILALLGENGAGKSTLMKILCGVHRPDAGQILLEARPVRFSGPREAQQAGISIIYQEFSLVPHLGVLGEYLPRSRASHPPGHARSIGDASRGAGTARAAGRRARRR